MCRFVQLLILFFTYLFGNGFFPFASPFEINPTDLTNSQSIVAAYYCRWYSSFFFFGCESSPRTTFGPSTFSTFVHLIYRVRENEGIFSGHCLRLKVDCTREQVNLLCVIRVFRFIFSSFLFIFIATVAVAIVAHSCDRIKRIKMLEVWFF